MNQPPDQQSGQPSRKSAGAGGRSADLEELLRAASSAIFRILPQPLSETFEFYSIRSHRLARLAIYLSASDPFTVNRRSQDIEDDSAFDYLVLVQLEGSAEIEQEKSRFLVNPDSLAIIPGGLPYRLSFLQTGKRLLLRIPLGVFHERVLGRQVRDFGAHVFSGAGLVQITIDLLKSLVVQAGNLSETEQYTVAEVTLDLIAAVVHAETDFEDSQHGSAQVARMSRILSYLEEHFADHDLTPARVAEANAVSTRHLHNLFQHSGLTVTRWIWERRLKAAREDLLNPALAELSITEIAYQRGFNDSAHFSRTFKTRFNISPSQLRKKIQQEALASPGVVMHD
ncbi:MAG: helix-turn-helix domain-containing protein [Lysobacterales bacterium]|nr:MAG: helix-turn-helix domain-containing protein [Xanthomonadales bacterium]